MFGLLNSINKELNYLCILIVFIVLIFSCNAKAPIEPLQESLGKIEYHTEGSNLDSGQLRSNVDKYPYPESNNRP